MLGQHWRNMVPQGKKSVADAISVHWKEIVHECQLHTARQGNVQRAKNSAATIKRTQGAPQRQPQSLLKVSSTSLRQPSRAAMLTDAPGVALWVKEQIVSVAVTSSRHIASCHDAFLWPERTRASSKDTSYQNHAPSWLLQDNRCRCRKWWTIRSEWLNDEQKEVQYLRCYCVQSRLKKNSKVPQVTHKTIVITYSRKKHLTN